jgi:hypothetical protein
MMVPEQFGFSDMLMAWAFLAIPVALAIWFGKLLNKARERDVRRREQDERDNQR